MYKLVIVGTIMAMAAASHPINEQMVSNIKKSATWKPLEASANPLKDYTHEELLGMLGTYIVPVNKAYARPAVVATPAEFDARTQWPSYVHPVRDQSQCGSCWAFGSSEALSDRFAIASSGAVNVVLSAEDLVSCDSSDYGCGGGYLENAWDYLTNTGIVTDACFPYTAGSGVEAACASSCVDGEAFKKYKCQAGSVVHPQTVDEIKSEIYQHGPMEAAFTVYEDFFSYSSGVYHHVYGGIAGGHAIKVLGWGHEDGLDYWLCANSWGTSWGLQGLFKIKIGDSGINDQLFACTPDLSTVSL